MTPSPIAITLATLIACQYFLVILIGPYLSKEYTLYFKQQPYQKLFFINYQIDKQNRQTPLRAFGCMV